MQIVTKLFGMIENKMLQKYSSHLRAFSENQIRSQWP